MHIEKKLFVNKQVAAATIIAIDSVNARRADISKAAPARVLVGAARVLPFRGGGGPHR
jgi:hypothetical protein